MAELFNPIGYLLGYVLWFLFDLFDNYPLAIFCVCLLIRLIIFPFDIKGKMATARNARFSKKQMEIQNKYKNNKQKMNEELAKLYQQEGFNPLGGCLPSLVPMVALMGVYCAIVSPLTNMIHISGEKVSSAFSAFGASGYYGQLDVIKKFPMNPGHWNIFSESETHAIMDFNKGFNFFGMDLFPIPAQSQFSDFVWVWPALSILTMFLTFFLAQKFNATPTPEGAGCIKYTPYLTSILFIMVIINAPAAVSFYQFISNLLTIIQNLIVNKYYNPHALTANMEARRIARRDAEEATVTRSF